MAYSVLSDIQDRISPEELVRLTDDADSGAVDEDRVSAAIADADAEIDAYCGTRYAVPLSPVPPMIARISGDLSAYNLFSRRPPLDEIQKERRKAAIDFLEKVAAGKVSLGVEDPDKTPAPFHAPDIASSDRQFSREGLEGF